MEENCNIQAALDAGRALGKPIALAGSTDAPRAVAFVLPAGAKLEQVDVEKYLPNPARAKGILGLADATSFAAYVNAHKQPSTVVLFTRKSTSMRAIFNDHVPGEPGWQDHGATYTCPLSPEWRAWTGNDAQHKAQSQFAEFIESRLPEITSPSSAVMLEMARGLQVRKDVDFGSAINLDNGTVNLRYKEEVSGTFRDGQMAVPGEFTVSIPIFEGGPIYAIDARLRYRLNSGKLVMWYELVRPEKSLEHAFEQALEVVKTAINGNATEPVPFYAITG
jgi:uncharacterized protein YfdQ (DUF2303 family)